MLPTTSISGELQIDDRPREQPLLSRGGPALRYGFAAGSVACALLVTYFVKPLGSSPQRLFFTAVILTSWYGMRAGLCTDSVDRRWMYFRGGLMSVQIDCRSRRRRRIRRVAWLTSFTQDRWARTHRTLVMGEEDMYVRGKFSTDYFRRKHRYCLGSTWRGAVFPRMPREAIFSTTFRCPTIALESASVMSAATVWDRHL